MKHLQASLTIGFLFLSGYLNAQTNTFPGSGNVGIGTTVPQVLFEVHTLPNNVISIGSPMNPGQFSGLHFGYLEQGNPYYRKSAMVFERLDAAARGKIHFLNNGGYNWESASLNDSHLTINYDGKVGIGNTEPTKTLDVKGSARFFTDENSVNEIQVGTTSSGYNGGAVTFMGAGGGAIGKIQGTYATATIGA